MTQERVPIGNYVTEYSVRNKANEDIPVYSVTNSQGFCTEYFDKEVASKDKSTYKIVPRGFFAYNPSRINVGSVDWQRSEERVIVSPLYNVFSVSDELDKQYLFYFLKSDIGKQMIKAKASGSVRDNLKMDMLKEMTIPKRTVQEQKECVAVLDELKEIISLHIERIGKYDELIKARFLEMFDLSKCAYKSLGECTDFVDYRGHTPELSEEGTIRMINAKSVGKGFFKYVDEFITEKTYESWMHRGFGCPGDILFVTEGHTFGNTCLIPGDMTKFALGQRVITIKGKEEIKNAFLCSYMQTDMFWKDINVYRTGGTAQGIRSKDLVKVTIPIPPIEQQKDFVKFVHQVDKSKVVALQMLDEAQKLFDSLMQEYFG